MMKSILLTIFGSLLFLGSLFGHGVEIGAIDTNNDNDVDKLKFINRQIYDGSSGTNVQSTVFFGTGSSVMPGTFASALGFEAIEGAESEAAVMNNGTAAFVQIEIVSVSGPAGGRFGVIRDAGVSLALTIDLPLGPNQTGTNLDISEGSPGEPFGDLTANGLFFNLPGDYHIVIRAVDRSGAFTPSDPLTLAFSTSHQLPSNPLLMIDTSIPTAGVTLHTASGADYFLMTSTDLQTWTPVGDPSHPWLYAIRGTGLPISIPTSISTNGTAFFRHTAARP